jgi:hypothetical protein
MQRTFDILGTLTNEKGIPSESNRKKGYLRFSRATLSRFSTLTRRTVKSESRFMGTLDRIAEPVESPTTEQIAVAVWQIVEA